MSSTETPPLGLEARLVRLEAIVTELEGVDLELEDALRLFEEGIGHIRATRELLATAELRVEQLLEDDAGEKVLQPDSAGSDE